MHFAQTQRCGVEVTLARVDAGKIVVRDNIGGKSRINRHQRLVILYTFTQ